MLFSRPTAAVFDSLSQFAAPSFPTTVAIVGAGAGDAGALTLRALDVIKAADIVYFDALVHDSILDLIPASVERIAVGKRAGKASANQDDIHDAMVAAAHKGKRVVRLKGGDPFIFGRGGEEASVLRAAGFEVEIIPGVTAAQVCAASTGIPLTDRRYAHRVTFITASTADETIPDFADLAGENRTLVIYMGGRVANKIARQIIATGVNRAMPVAAIINGGRANQILLRTTLEALGANAFELPTGDPLLLIIGMVVGARDDECLTTPAPISDIYYAHG